jgi:hypothetical protein
MTLADGTFPGRSGHDGRDQGRAAGIKEGATESPWKRKGEIYATMKVTENSN